MGTVEKICDVMLKMGTEKKTMATSRYEDHSAWLLHEFSLIRQLIERSPKGSTKPSFPKVTKQQQQQTFAVENSMTSSVSTSENHAKSSSGATSSSSSSSAAPASPEPAPVAVAADVPQMSVTSVQNKGQKRKSPEIAIGSIRNSPDTKRNSVDYAELAEAAGLPLDLNKLKKEHLLSEIDARGGAEGISMKSLKKDMIEALKLLLVVDNIDGIESENEPMSNVEEDKENSVEIVDESFASDNIIDLSCDVEADTMPISAQVKVPVVSSGESEESTSGVKKGSVMNELRNQVQSSQTKIETEDQLRDRAAAEFQARQRRHRDSQARKSLTDNKNLLTSPSSAVSPSSHANKLPPRTPEVEIMSPVQVAKTEESPMDISPSPIKHSSTMLPVRQLDSESLELSPVPHSPVMDSKSMSSPVQISVSIKEQDQSKFAQKEQNTVKPVSTQVAVEKTLEQANNKWGKSTVTAPVETSVAAPVEKVKTKGGLFGFMKSAKLLLSGQKAPKPKADLTLTQKAQAAEGPTTIADLRALLAAESNGTEPEEPENESKSLSVPMTPESKNSSKDADVVAEVPLKIEVKAEVAAPVVLTIPTPTPAVVTTAHVAATTTPPPLQMVSPPVVVEAPKVTEAKVETHEVVKEVPVVVENKLTEKNLAALNAAAVASSQTPPPVEKPSEDEYQMDDRDSTGSSDSGSGTDDESSKKEKKQKTIPEWARGAQLKEALERQYGLNGHTAMDPDLIFPEVQSCNLEEIFGKKEGKFGKYSKRTSSAQWDADELTLVEKRTYRTQMGF